VELIEIHLIGFMALSVVLQPGTSHPGIFERHDRSWYELLNLGKEPAVEIRTSKHYSIGLSFLTDNYYSRAKNTKNILMTARSSLKKGIGFLKSSESQKIMLSSIE